MSDRAAAAVAGWRRAEERLYPLAMVDPDSYLRLVSVVRAAADMLSDLATTDELVEARPQGREIVARAADAVDVPVTQISDIELVADAAFVLRHREAAGAQHHREVVDRIAHARGEGRPRVIVRESGRADQPALQPYERIEMRVEDGRGLRALVDVDPSTYRPVYTLEAVTLDPDTGLLLDDAAPGPSQTFTEREPWESAWRRWRSERSDLP